jgi:hypothetical protein
MTAAALAAAIELGAKGIPAFPCAQSKRPTCADGFYNAETDADALRDLWRKHPGPLVGVPTGPASGIDVLDIDAKHPPAIEWLRKNEFRLPTTRRHRTRSGGFHVLFKYADGLRCSTSKIAQGIDVRALGGYIVWWPSAGLAVEVDAPLALWPAWLFAQLTGAKPKLQLVWSASRVPNADISGLVRFVARASEPGRNQSTFWAACRAGEMVAKGLINADFAAALIVEAAISTGLSSDEARRTVASGLSRTGGGSNAG